MHFKRLVHHSWTPETFGPLWEAEEDGVLDEAKLLHKDARTGPQVLTIRRNWHKKVRHWLVVAGTAPGRQLSIRCKRKISIF